MLSGYHNNKCRQPGVKYQINDLVYLSTKNLTLPKHRARKLMPKFIGPYKILKAMNESSNVTLELPQEFKDRKINPTFHTNLVRPYIKNDDILFPKRDTKVVGLYRNVRINDLNLSVGITNPRRLNLIFIASVTVKHYILYKFTLIFIYIFISKIIIEM